MTGLLALDPGDSIGWAWMTETGTLIDFSTVNRKGLLNLLSTVLPTTIVIEQFVLFPWKSQALGWSSMSTSQCIGSVDMWAEIYEVPMTQQSVDNRDMGYMWGKIPKQKTHRNSHKYDALAHAVYYMGHVRNVMYYEGVII